MSTRVRLTRDSVCAGDDVDAPHAHTVFTDAAAASPEALVALIEAIASDYLPHVEGRAGWTVSSGVPLGVLAGRDAPLRLLPLAEADLTRLDRREGALHLHFAYLGHDDPDRAYRQARAALVASGAIARASLVDRLLGRRG